MGLYEHYPYTNFHELNLNWILEELKRALEEIKIHQEQSLIHYADPIQWNIIRQYTVNTVVVDPATGIAYISTTAVPDNIQITNTEYWSPIFDLSQLFDDVDESIRALQTAVDSLNTDLGEETEARSAADAEINASITTLTDKVNDLRERTVMDFGAVADGSTDDLSAFQAAIQSGKPFTVPEGNYYLSQYLFTTDEHCTENAGTYAGKALIVTSFKLSLAGLAEVPFTNVETGFNGFPYTGICVDTRRNRIIVGAGDGGTGSGGLIAFDLNTGDVLNHYSLSEVGHCNDLAYDPEADLIYCASYSDTNTTSLTVINASSLTFREYKNLGYPVHTVSYDPDNKLFYVSDYTVCHIYDHSWNQIRTFNIGIQSSFLAENYLPSGSIGVDGQGTFIKDGTLYYMLWIRNSTEESNNGYFYAYGNAIVCFNGENLTPKDVYTIPNSNAYDELEAFEYVNGRLIGVTNNRNRGGKITYWKAENAKSAVMPFAPVEFLTTDDVIVNRENNYYSVGEASAYKVGKLVIMQIRVDCGAEITNQWTTVATIKEYVKPVGAMSGNTRGIGFEMGATNLNTAAACMIPLSMDGFGNLLIKGGIANKAFLLQLVYVTNA